MEAARTKYMAEAEASAVLLDASAAEPVQPDAVPEALLSPNKARAPAELKPAKKDDYERDTEAPEETDLMGLLLPDGQLPQSADKFSLQYSMAAFRGWVKQRSPACAAASVAGSWNALMGVGRAEEGALGQDDVVAVFEKMLEESIAKKRGRVERLLGAPIDAVDAALRVKIGESGKSLGGKKEQKLTKKQLVRLLKEVVAEAAAAAPPATPPATPPPVDGADENVPPPPAGDDEAQPDEGQEEERPTMDPAMALFHEIFSKEPEEVSTANLHAPPLAALRSSHRRRPCFRSRRWRPPRRTRRTMAAMGMRTARARLRVGSPWRRRSRRRSTRMLRRWRSWRSSTAGAGRRPSPGRRRRARRKRRKT